MTDGTTLANGVIEAAERLRRAYAGPPIAPLRDVLAPDDVDRAYQVQAENTRRWVGEGRRIVGRKIGLTAESVQRQLGVDQPDYGVLFADMRLADGEDLPLERLLQGKAEAEVALVLARGLPGVDATPDDVLAATAFACAAIEIVDSRIADWKITIADTIADNASSAAFVLGREQVDPRALDLAECAMTMTVDGERVSSGVGRACLGHPLQAASWLANTLARRGEPLGPGDIVLTGALGPMVTLRPRTRIDAEIGGLGTVGFTFGGVTR